MALYSQDLTYYLVEGGRQTASEELFTLYEIARYYSDGFGLRGTGSLAEYGIVIPYQGGTDGVQPETSGARRDIDTLTRSKRRELLLIVDKLARTGNVVTISTSSYTCYARASRHVERGGFLHNPGEILVP